MNMHKQQQFWLLMKWWTKTRSSAACQDRMLTTFSLHREAVGLSGRWEAQFRRQFSGLLMLTGICPLLFYQRIQQPNHSGFTRSFTRTPASCASECDGVTKPLLLHGQGARQYLLPCLIPQPPAMFDQPHWKFELWGAFKMWVLFSPAPRYCKEWQREPEGTWGNLREPEGTWGNLREPEGTWGNLREPEGTWGNLREPEGTPGEDSFLLKKLFGLAHQEYCWEALEVLGYAAKWIYPARRGPTRQVSLSITNGELGIHGEYELYIISYKQMNRYTNIYIYICCFIYLNIKCVYIYMFVCVCACCIPI